MTEGGGIIGHLVTEANENRLCAVRGVHRAVAGADRWVARGDARDVCADDGTRPTADHGPRRVAE